MRDRKRRADLNQRVEVSENPHAVNCPTSRLFRWLPDKARALLPGLSRVSVNVVWSKALPGSLGVRILHFSLDAEVSPDKPTSPTARSK